MFSVLKDNKTLLETFSCFVERKLEPYRDLEYAYLVMSKEDPAKIFIVSSYPDEWVRLYKENNFQNYDPVVLTALHRSLPFSWDDDLALISDIKFNKIFQLSKKYNIINGYTFVLHDQSNNLALLSFVIDNKHSEPEKYLKEHLNNAQMLLIEINEQMHKLSEMTFGEKEKNRIDSLHCVFSKRENEVVYWTKKGKSYADIASIMNISQSTVKFHMKNVINKLGANNARQAVGLSVEFNLIKPIF